MMPRVKRKDNIEKIIQKYFKTSGLDMLMALIQHRRNKYLRDKVDVVPFAVRLILRANVVGMLIMIMRPRKCVVYCVGLVM